MFRGVLGALRKADVLFCVVIRGRQALSALHMVVVGKHLAFLLIVVWWEIPTDLLKFEFGAPFPTSAKFRP